jgi:hypothetical protein
MWIGPDGAIQGKGAAMSIGWRIGFWAAMAISAAWFLLGLVASGYLLFAGTDGAWRLHQRPFTELIVGAVVIVQPSFVLWAIIRAYKLRHDGPAVSAIGRAALPLSTILLIVATVAANVYNQNRLMKIAMRQRSTGSITFDCSEKPRTMDFDRRTIGPINLRLTSTKHDGEQRRWAVQWPGAAPIPAKKFDASTGSIGGSQGLSWTDANGRPVSALLSFSDILGPYGPESIWITVVQAEQAKIQQKLDAGERRDFTCGPDPKSYHE